MTRMVRIGLLGLTLGLGACAGAGESPKTADMIFPIPYLLKQQRTNPLPPYGGRHAPAPVTSATKP
jgi:hypothetical protein